MRTDQPPEIPKFQPDYQEGFMDNSVPIRGDDMKKAILKAKIADVLDRTRHVGPNDPCPCGKRKKGTPELKETGGKAPPRRDPYALKFKVCCGPQVARLKRLKLTGF